MKIGEKELALSKEERAEAIRHLQAYLEEKFEAKIGNLSGELFLDFIAEKIGIYYYNLGVVDSIALMNEKTEDLYLLMKMAKR